MALLQDLLQFSPDLCDNLTNGLAVSSNFEGWFLVARELRKINISVNQKTIRDIETHGLSKTAHDRARLFVMVCANLGISAIAFLEAMRAARRTELVEYLNKVLTSYNQQNLTSPLQIYRWDGIRMPSGALTNVAAIATSPNSARRAIAERFRDAPAVEMIIRVEVGIRDPVVLPIQDGTAWVTQF